MIQKVIAALGKSGLCSYTSMAEGDYTISTGVTSRDELGALAKDLDALACRLDEASRESRKPEQLRKDFVSNVSHELRTPVTVLRSSLEALCDGVIQKPKAVAEYRPGNNTM